MRREQRRQMSIMDNVIINPHAQLKATRESESADCGARLLTVTVTTTEDEIIQFPPAAAHSHPPPETSRESKAGMPRCRKRHFMNGRGQAAIHGIKRFLSRALPGKRGIHVGHPHANTRASRRPCPRSGKPGRGTIFRPL